MENVMKMGWRLIRGQGGSRFKSKIIEKIFLGAKTEMEKNH
jgi:hypothetical protein